MEEQIEKIVDQTASEFIPFGQKTKTTSPSSLFTTTVKKSTSPRSTTRPDSVSNSTVSKGTTTKLRFGQKFPKTTSVLETSTQINEVDTDIKFANAKTTTTLSTTSTSESRTVISTEPATTSSSRRRVTKSTTVTSTPLNTSRRRSTTQVC